MPDETKLNRPSVTNQAVITVPYEMDATSPAFERYPPKPLKVIFKLYVVNDDRFRLQNEVEDKEIPQVFLEMIPPTFDERRWSHYETIMNLEKGSKDRWVIDIAYSDPAERMDTDV